MPSPLHVGGQVKIHIRGSDRVGEVVAMSRSRVTVRYTDAYGDERIVKVPVEHASAAATAA